MRIIIRAAGTLFTTAALATALAPAAGASTIAGPNHVAAVNSTTHPADDNWTQFSGGSGYADHDPGDDPDAGNHHR